MYLSPEIIDNILSRYIYPARLEHYPCSDSPSPFITHHLLWRDFIETDQHNGLGQQRPGLDYRMQLDNAILKLRLVSFEWNNCVTALLDKYRITWMVNLDSESSLQRALACLTEHERSINTAKTRIMPTRELVKRLRINAGNGDDVDMSDVASHPHIEQSVLRQIFQNLNHLESFSLIFPVQESKHYELDWVDLVTEATSAAIRDTGVLRNVTDLQLKVPSTYHTGKTLGAVNGPERIGMLNLLLQIMDETGFSGSHASLMNTYGEDEDYDGTVDDEDIRDEFDESEKEEMEQKFLEKGYSVLQMKYPNRNHQQALWDFIASCPNLETLSIRGTHYLNLDELDWKRGSDFRGLRVLHLERIHTKLSSVLQLIRPTDITKPSRVQRIAFDDVKVRADGGNWGEDFLSYLLNDCPELNFYHLYMLTYFADHERGLTPGALEDTDLVRSDNNEDLVPMSELAIKLMGRFNGPDAWPYSLRDLIDSVKWNIEDGDVRESMNVKIPIYRGRIVELHEVDSY